MKFLIDTNRYFDFAKGQKEIVDLFASADCICVPHVVLAELRAGFRCGTVARRNEQVLTKFLENKRVKVLYADDMTTQCYADIAAPHAGDADSDERHLDRRARGAAFASAVFA